MEDSKCKILLEEQKEEGQAECSRAIRGVVDDTIPIFRCLRRSGEEDRNDNGTALQGSIDLGSGVLSGAAGRISPIIEDREHIVSVREWRYPWF